MRVSIREQEGSLSIISTPLVPILGDEEKNFGDTLNPSSILLHRVDAGLSWARTMPQDRPGPGKRRFRPLHTIGVGGIA